MQFVDFCNFLVPSKQCYLKKNTLQFSLPYRLTKVVIREKFRIKASDIVCGVREESKKLSMCDYCKFVPSIFVHFSVLFKPYVKASRKRRSVISDFIFNVPHGKLVYPPKIYLPTLTIVTVGPFPSHPE